MGAISYTVNGQTSWFDAQTLQEAMKKIREIECLYNVPGNTFSWTHPISEQTKGLADDDKILLNE
jgi:hypothetical protein